MLEVDVDIVILFFPKKICKKNKIFTISMPLLMLC